MPFVSILVASKNQSVYLKDMISALKAQSFQDFEVIVVDAYSTDGSPEIFKNYEKVKFIQRIGDANSAYVEALKNSSGKYIMIATTSDFLYSYRWIEIAVNNLESDEELSCVWGSGVVVSENGCVRTLWAEHYLVSTPPWKNKYLYFWLYLPYLPELNYVVKADVFKLCIDSKEIINDSFNLNNIFLYKFTSNGYLQAYIPEIANAGRIHGNSLTTKNEKIDRAQYISFFKLRIKFIFALYFNGKEFYFKNSKSENLNHYQLDKFLVFIFKLIVLIFKDNLRRLLKIVSKFVYN
jgi:glycosyltransferase involved in cell wall biosynthesis